MNYHFERRGKEIERELLGTIKRTHEKVMEQKRIDSFIEKNRVIADEAAVAYVKEMQSSNPENPNRPFANLVRYEIIDDLENAGMELENEDSLKYYTSISPDPDQETMLDRDLGIDCFFELTFKGKTYEVSIDITNGKVKGSPKAAVIQDIPDDFPTHARFDEKKLFDITGVTPDEKKTFYRYTNELSKEVAAKFKKIIALTQTPVNT